ELRSLDELLDGVPPGRVELHRDDELALTQPALERRRRPQRAEARGLADRRRADADHRAARLASHAGLPIEHLAHGRDVLGRRARSTPEGPVNVTPPFVNAICATIGRSVTDRTASRASAISTKSENVSTTNASTPPSRSASACSRNATRASSAVTVPRGARY